MKSSLAGKVIVMTGASSGIGRAAAIEFARLGALPVLAARQAPALEEVAELCRRAGSQALVVPTDVTDEAAVGRLAARALELTGRVDVWVNNAGVTVFALLDEGPFEPHRRVIEINVYGAMFGARAILPVFKRQHAGVLINVSSVLGKVGQPYVPSYVISKFALHHLFPRMTDRMLLHVTREWHFGHQPQPITAGDLYSPSEKPDQVRGHRPALTAFPGILLWGAGHLARGLWRRRSRPTSLRPHSSP